MARREALGLRGLLLAAGVVVLVAFVWYAEPAAVAARLGRMGLGKALSAVIPASLGGQEGGNVLVLAGFGYPLAASVGYSVLRRVRELVWAGIGLALLSRGGRARDGPPEAE